jgi:hypothetical protein
MRAAALAIAVSTQSPTSAVAADKHACVSAHEQAQELRHAAKLREAREKLVACSQETCPALVRQDCAPWLSEIDGVLPSIVPVARNERGAEAFDVRLFIDGALVAQRLDGKAIDVDPGDHVLRFEHAPSRPLEERIVVREGEKARPIEVSFASVEAPALAANARRGPGVLPYVLAGGAAAAFSSFAYFGIRGIGDSNACNHSCNADQSDAITNRFRIADISLVTGVVLGGAALWMILSASGKPDSKSAPANSVSEASVVLAF